MTPSTGDTIVQRNATTNRLILAMVAIGIVALVALASVGLYFQLTSNTRLLSIGRDNHANGHQIKQALDVLNAATGPDSQARSAGVLSGAISDLRKSIDCAALYSIGQRPPACAAVDQRLDSLSAGGDPFTPSKGP